MIADYVRDWVEATTVEEWDDAVANILESLIPVHRHQAFLNHRSEWVDRVKLIDQVARHLQSRSDRG